MGKNPYLPRCSWNILQLRGSLSWYRPGEITFFNYAVTKLHRCRHPYVSSYTEQRNHLHSTIFRLRQREGSGFSENLPKRHDSTSTLSEWLVPTLWSLVLISLAVTSAVYVHLLCVLQLSLSRTTPQRVLCRSLAGCSQRITTPYFIRSSFLRSFFYLLSLLQDHYITTMRECQVFILRKIFIHLGFCLTDCLIVIFLSLFGSILSLQFLSGRGFEVVSTFFELYEQFLLSHPVL